MKSKRWDKDALQGVQLVSPGEGVFKVALQDGNGINVAEFVLAGGSTSQRLQLPKGRYAASVLDVGQKKLGETNFTITAGNTQSIQLGMPGETLRGGGDRKRTSGSSIKRWGRQQPSKIERFSTFASKSEMESPSAKRRRKRSGGKVSFDSDAVRGFGFIGNDAATDEGFDHFVEIPVQSLEAATPAQAESEPSTDCRKFDIGLSEDGQLGKRGGWLEPDDLTIGTHADPDTGILQIDIKDDRPEGRKSRVRISCSVEGLQTIRVPVPLYREGVSIFLHPRMGKDSVDFWIGLDAKDPAIEALVVALERMGREDALATLSSNGGGIDDAILILGKKRRDLWAATVAALILARTGNVGNRLQWFHNLADWAPHIADAPISAAWAEAARGEGDTIQIEARIFELLERSMAIGAPNFTAGHMMGLELLDSLRSTASDKAMRSAADGRYRQWMSRSKSRLFESAYLMWEHLGTSLTKGKLPDQRYLSVASGELGLNGFAIKGGI